MKTIAEKFIEKKAQILSMPNPKDVWKAAQGYLQANATSSTGSFQAYLLAHCPGVTQQNVVSAMASLFGMPQPQGITSPIGVANAFGDSSFESSSSSVSGPGAAIGLVK